MSHVFQKFRMGKPQGFPRPHLHNNNHNNNNYNNNNNHLVNNQPYGHQHSNTVRVDGIINTLLENVNAPQIDLPEEDILWLLQVSREVFMSQPMLLELHAPVCIVGDIHGQFIDLYRTFQKVGFLPKTNFLFLGDYVDRGRQSIECICLLLAYKVKYPEKCFLLRGNHESARVNSFYGFYDECKRRYNVKLWKAFGDTFNCLPVAALIDEKILCMHGGLSPKLGNLSQIRRLPRPGEIPEEGLLCDLLWSDPQIAALGWVSSQRGVSQCFGEDVVEGTLQNLGLDLIVRAHQVVENGYDFFCNRKLITIFGAPNYCGEFDNDAAVLTVDLNLKCAPVILKPLTVGLTHTRPPHPDSPPPTSLATRPVTPPMTGTNTLGFARPSSPAPNMMNSTQCATGGTTSPAQWYTNNYNTTTNNNGYPTTHNQHTYVSGRHATSPLRLSPATHTHSPSPTGGYTGNSPNYGLTSHSPHTHTPSPPPMGRTHSLSPPPQGGTYSTLGTHNNPYMTHTQSHSSPPPRYDQYTYY
eukprot:TRINITY_DN67017_c10_g3_i1.p1 TRINITY_DN67017_c10_g3~~TRINITY_DN67017_c10_g3_i1.p1  ORF type:complete len:525 (-),score=31.65 TRINITY_DN67017_c10_g3_i1:358-1932(-)